MIFHTTKSMCSQCYHEVAATITIEDMVKITKHCPVHGDESGILEIDPAFYLETQRYNAPIYAGHLVDVTTRCNLDCKYCYFAKGGTDYTLAAILTECMLNKGPYILTGGEPTLRQDLPSIIAACSDVGPTMMLTNGAGLLDKNYLLACTEKLATSDGYHGIGLSYHPEFDQFDAVIENLHSAGIKIDTVFYVVDELSQIQRAIDFNRKHKGLAATIRIKCASNIWSEDGAGKIYLSQVMKYMEKQGPVIWNNDIKSVYVPFMFEGSTFAAISWHDIHNVDLGAINCPPTYRAKSGEVCDFVKAMLINEGMAKGLLNGAKL